MLSPELAKRYPKLLSDGGVERSPKTPKYNCIAWAAEWDDQKWWQPDAFEPGMHWPEGVRDDGSILCFLELFQSLGYRTCESANFEVFHEKVAIYVNPNGEFTHVARQTDSGTWWSKLGDDEDVYHKTPEGLESKSYGKPKYLMRRRIKPFAILRRCFFKIVRGVQA